MNVGASPEHLLRIQRRMAAGRAKTDPPEDGTDWISSAQQWLSALTRKAPDRRRTTRHTFDVAIEIRTDTAGATLRGVARDLSEKGMGAIVYGDLSVGDT